MQWTIFFLKKNQRILKWLTLTFWDFYVISRNSSRLEDTVWKMWSLEIFSALHFINSRHPLCGSVSVATLDKGYSSHDYITDCTSSPTFLFFIGSTTTCPITLITTRIDWYSTIDRNSFLFCCQKKRREDND